MFHDVRGGTTMQLQREFSSFLVGMHFGSDKTNLAMYVS